MNKLLKEITAVAAAILLCSGLVVIIPEPAQAATVSAGSEAALKTGLEKGDVKLTADIVLSEGIVVPDGLTAVLDLNGHTLDRGLTECIDKGSVIRVEYGGTLTIKDSSDNGTGVITGGRSWNGGGICNHGTLTIEGGTISGNQARHEKYGGGAGIYNDKYNGTGALLILKGGVITDNDARRGGGIYNGADGTIRIEAGTKTTRKELIPTNVQITGNRASQDGDGIYNAGSVQMKGAPDISGNDGDDIYLTNGKTITVTGQLEVPSPIGLRSEASGTVTAVEAYGKYNSITSTGFGGTESAKYPITFTTYVPVSRTFYSVAASYTAILSGNNVVLQAPSSGTTTVEVFVNGRLFDTTMKCSTPQKAWDEYLGYMPNIQASKDSGILKETDEVDATITLGSDWISDAQIEVSSGESLTIDLNGYSIRRNLSEEISEGSVFFVNSNAKLKIIDSSPDSKGYDGIKGGVIAGGRCTNAAGGIRIAEGAEFTMEGGAIYDCSTSSHGGAISAEQACTISMSNCAVIGCRANLKSKGNNGGAIYLYRCVDMTLKDMKIQDCYAYNSGGAIYCAVKGMDDKIRIDNVLFSGNKAENNGGAISIEQEDSEASSLSAFQKAYKDVSPKLDFLCRNCLFAGNKAANNGGVLYIAASDSSSDTLATQFRYCTFRENTSGSSGSAIYVNSDKTVFTGCTVTDNTAGSAGALYVADSYAATVKEQTIIRSNSSEADTTKGSNVILGKNAFIYDGGLYNGSELWVGSTQTGSSRVAADVNQYNSNYYHADSGGLFIETSTVWDSSMVTSSLFGNGSVWVMISILIMCICTIAAALLFKKRTGTADYENEDE